MGFEEQTREYANRQRNARNSRKVFKKIRR